MAKKKSGKSQEQLSFEDALERLEAIVRDLEEADLPLEKSLEVFEEGVRLSRLLSGRLEEAEKKVEVLLRDDTGGKKPVPFEEDSSPPPESGEDEGEGEGEDVEKEQGGLPF